MHRMLINAKQNDHLPEVTLARQTALWAALCSNSLRTATIGPLHKHQTIVFLDEYYTWHTLLPMC